MADTFEFTLNNPLTEEQWDEITDVDFDRTDRITFHTKHGKEVEFAKVRHAKWIPCAKSGLILTEQMRKEGIRWYGFKCSACNFVRKGNAPRDATYCECCGARMDEERKEE